ncbi:MAG TPA: hypothetical protein VHA52_05580 [Candidatus Babeliaceae bacterium]|nr:hypothetical protein [Candidatus Babeliaceae bacterium]
MKKLYFTGLTISILAFSNCSNKLLLGTYENRIKGSSYSTIKINSDSSFNYEYRSGEWDSHNSFGNWNRRGKIIILNSKYKKDSLPIQAEERMDTSLKGYKFSFLKFPDPESNKVLWQNLIINDTFKIKVRDSAIIVNYPLGEIKRFKVQIVWTMFLTDTVGSYTLNTASYKPQKSNSNSFVVNYPFFVKLLTYQDFINEEFRIKHKGIYWTEKRLNYYFIQH